MSSTSRGVRRAKWDYYITPQNAIYDFMREFAYHEDLHGMQILDPCAGGDATHEMSYPKVLSGFGFSNIRTIDIREDSRAEVKSDYLNCILAIQPDMILTMLERLNFLGGKTYKKVFWDKVGLPKYIFVHRNRMSFTEDGKTDSIAYAHYVWQKGYSPKFSKIMII